MMHLRMLSHHCYTFKYNNGAIASLSASFTTELPNEAVIMFEGGSIRLFCPFWCPTKMSIERDGQVIEIIEEKSWGAGYTYEALHTMKAIEKGAIEHPYMSHHETLINIKIMDELRALWGLQYPLE